MTAGELRNKIAGCGPNVPVILYLDGKYHRIYSRWQNHVSECLTRDVSIQEATQGAGITALVLTVEE